MSKTKNFQIHIHLPLILNDMLSKESYELRLSKQEIIRTCLRNHFSKKYGKDVYLDCHEIRNDIMKAKR